jgi:hypothetical protein
MSAKKIERSLMPEKPVERTKNLTYENIAGRDHEPSSSRRAPEEGAQKLFYTREYVRREKMWY